VFLQTQQLLGHAIDLVRPVAGPQTRRQSSAA
jgi:hypothetical protein